jgi:WD40 repeat protein
MEFDEQTDYISDLYYNAHTHALVATCGDGTLAVYDLRKGKLWERSDDTEDDEMLSCTMAKNDSKVVVGSQGGVLNLYSWGHFEDCSDRYPGHPDSIDCIVPFDESRIFTGCGDGVVRVVSILPNRVDGVLGAVGKDESVQSLALSSDKGVLAACDASEYLYLWSTSQVDAADTGAVSALGVLLAGTVPCMAWPAISCCDTYRGRPHAVVHILEAFWTAIASAVVVAPSYLLSNSAATGGCHNLGSAHTVIGCLWSLLSMHGPYIHAVYFTRELLQMDLMMTRRLAQMEMMLTAAHQKRNRRKSERSKQAPRKVL